MSVRVRFAPSPTGALHIGGLRTALFNYLFAKKHNGTFVLRIEDTDQSRKVDGAEAYIKNALEWIGINPEEGPNKGGAFGPYRQHERKELYKKEIGRLIENGKAYYAFDTPKALVDLRKTNEEKGEVFKYGAHNRNELLNSLNLSEEETKKRLNEDAYVIRLKVDPGEVIAVEDKIRGEITVSSNELDDKILMKADGMPTYHFANVVDDHLMNITHVIRGEEWLPSLPLHKLLYNALEWEAPEFMHLPLILKPKGKGKLSKRDGEQLGFPVFPLAWDGSKGFKERGFLPEALLNYLSLLGWSPGTEKEIFKLEELILSFDVNKIQKGGARFDFEKARWINHKFLGFTDVKSILERFPEFLERGMSVWPEKKKYAVYELLKERLFLLEDIKKEIRPFIADPVEYDPKVVGKIKGGNPGMVLDLFIELIENGVAPEDWKEEIFKWNEKAKLKFGMIMQSLRLAIVGNLSGPDIFKVCSLLEKEVTLNRIIKFKNYLKN